MGLFQYKEKRYGKTTLILFALILIAIASVSIFGGIYAVLNMTHWSKFVIVVLTSIIGLFLGCLGIVIIALSFSLTNAKQSVRDGNEAIGIANTYLCDKCGRVISENAEFCEHCGQKQIGKESKKCPKCNALNNASAEYCEKCGEKLNK